MAGKKDDDNPFKGALKAKLKKLDIQTVEKKAAAERQAAWERAQKEREREEAMRSAGEVTKSDEELFAEAFESMNAEEVYRGKYGTPGDNWRPMKDLDAVKAEAKGSAHEDDEAAREKLTELRDMRMLEQFVGKMDEKFASTKYREKAPRHEVTEAESPFDTPLLPSHGDGLREIDLAPAQRELLKRFQKFERENRVPEVNLRGETRDEAMERMDTFIPNCFHRGDDFIRIICGRGKNSAGEPVIKPAVLAWLEGPGAKMVKGYAPEVGASGDYGSIVVAFQRDKASKDDIKKGKGKGKSRKKGRST